MKLKELAEIKIGLKIDSKLLSKEKKINGVYFQYIQASDFTDGQSTYISQKELRKTPEYSTKSFLSYGDYIIYKKNGKNQLLRNENSSGQTILGNGLICLTIELGILNEFLSSANNRRYFCNELDKLDEEYGSLDKIQLGLIEIGTDNIRELEESNKAELLGIRKPINLTDWPFRIAQKPVTIDKLLKRISHNELILDSEFQRRPGLWDITTKSRLIESLIIRLPLPAFYFDGTDDNKWLVIDGLQRLSAVNSYLNQEFELEGLDYLPDLEGKTFIELDRAHQRNIEEFEVFAYIIEKGTPKSVTYKVFKNINTSALKLEPQEIRHAINPGSPAEFLKLVAEKEWFKKTLTLSPREIDRMLDRETALRFIAFKRKKYIEYKPSMPEFLDEAMTDIYEIPAHKRDLYLIEMENIFSIIYDTLGNSAFTRSLFDNSRAYGHNNILFELITYGISITPTDKRNKLKESSVKFKEHLIEYFANKPDRYWEHEYAYSLENLKKRFEEIELLFKKIVQ